MTTLLQILNTRPRRETVVYGFSGQITTPFSTKQGRTGPQNARVALCISDPAVFIRTLIALDGFVPSVTLLSCSLAPEVVTALCEKADCDHLVTDRDDLNPGCNVISPEHAQNDLPGDACATIWVMTSSGTTGLPKLVSHSLATLSRTVVRKVLRATPRWGLVYDPTRFAGMQVVLQALLGGGAIIVPDTSAPLQEQIALLAQHRCTHLSATPTLWRRLLMAPGFIDLQLEQITLGGEIVDQQVLDSLRVAFPKARITHIYASTEAGVGFAVTDEKEGFPEAYLTQNGSGIGLKIVDNILWLRRAPSAEGLPLAHHITLDEDAFISSGDLVEIKAGRVHFLGRANGVINVGGVKVHPEQIEQTIMTVPGVHMASVTSKKSPISGALVVADIIPASGQDPKTLRANILAHCRAVLEREAVPAIMKFVDTIELNAAGKLIRK